MFFKLKISYNKCYNQAFKTYSIFFIQSTLVFKSMLSLKNLSICISQIYNTCMCSIKNWQKAFTSYMYLVYSCSNNYRCNYIYIHVGVWTCWLKNRQRAHWYYWSITATLSTAVLNCWIGNWLRTDVMLLEYNCNIKYSCTYLLTRELTEDGCDVTGV